MSAKEDSAKEEEKVWRVPWRIVTAQGEMKVRAKSKEEAIEKAYENECEEDDEEATHDFEVEEDEVEEVEVKPKPATTPPATPTKAEAFAVRVKAWVEKADEAIAEAIPYEHASENTAWKDIDEALDELLREAYHEGRQDEENEARNRFGV